MTEEQLLQYLAQNLPRERLIAGVGDDCAVVEEEGQWLLLTTDAMIEGIHFELSYFSPAYLARKLAAINLSDIAAMGGRPKYALLTIGFPAPPQEDFVKAFFQALNERLAEFGAQLVGGDTVRSPSGLFLNLVLIGTTAPGKTIFRNRAKVGDLVFVSRPLGAASAGLEQLQKGLFEPKALVEAHLDPTPEIELGSRLAEAGLPSAMMDISDGLAIDLARLCKASGVGAEIHEEKIPLMQEIYQTKLSRPALWYALAGGEDFALLFTLPPEREKDLWTLFSSLGRKPFKIGHIIPETNNVVYLLHQDGAKEEISSLGFDHFA